jgi:hypothetical protein
MNWSWITLTVAIMLLVTFFVLALRGQWAPIAFWGGIMSLLLSAGINANKGMKRLKDKGGD